MVTIKAPILGFSGWGFYDFGFGCRGLGIRISRLWARIQGLGVKGFRIGVWVCGLGLRAEPFRGVGKQGFGVLANVGDCCRVFRCPLCSKI